MVDFRRQDFEACMALAGLSLTTGEAERIGSELLDLSSLDDLVDGAKQIESVLTATTQADTACRRPDGLACLTLQPPRVRDRSSQAS